MDNLLTFYDVTRGRVQGVEVHDFTNIAFFALEPSVFEILKNEENICNLHILRFPQPYKT